MMNFSFRHALLSFETFIVAIAANSQITVNVYCDQWAEYPLVKKIGLYQTPLVSKEWLARDMPKLAELEARSMRYEMACGKDDLYGQPCVTGSAKNLTYNLTDINYLLTQAKRYSPVLVISHGYTPTLLQSRPTEWSGFMDRPTDLDTWAAINERFAKEWKAKRYTNSYVEIWNEPDLKDGFFTGTVDDYLDIYQSAAPAVNKGYADIKVGGPAGAFNGWHQPLVDRVKANNLPLDFLSGHAYGAEYAWQLDAMRSALTRLGNNEAEMLLTEYSPYAAADYQKDGPVERAEAAMTFFNALPGMLECPDLTYVNWAQYIDPGFFVGDKLGLIDRDSGSRKALFNAFKLYGMMPADRRRITIVGQGANGMASASPTCVTAVVWNTQSEEKTVKIVLNNIPFTSGQLEVYHIDESHNSWYETKKGGALVKSTSEQIDIEGGRVVVEDVVRSKGVCFIRITADGTTTLFPQIRLGTIVRTHQWFPNRSNKAAYALFDPKTWTVRLSSNQEATGWALVGIEVENMNDVLKVDGIAKGSMLKRNSNSTLNIRVDYQDTEGKYIKSTLYHAGLYSADRKTLLPWGTQRQPDEVIEVDNINDFSIDIASHAPSNFSGRIILSFDMLAVGAGAKQNFQLTRGTATDIQHVYDDCTMQNGTNTQTASIYNLSGLQIMHTSKGINIIMTPDGRCRKVFKTGK